MKKIIHWALDRPLWQAILICVVPVLAFSFVIMFAYAIHARRVERLEEQKAILELEIKTRDADLAAKKHHEDFEHNVRVADEYRRRSTETSEQLEALRKSGEEFAKTVKETRSWQEIDKLLNRESQE